MTADRAQATRDLLRSAEFGVLSTLQQSRAQGYPMASLAPYALGPRGEPLFAFSGLAQHTRNLLADPRACLYVAVEGEGDPQELARVTLLGRVRPAEEADAEALKTRYLAAHPEAEQFFELDFAIYVMAVEEVRFIGGFGAAAWIAAGEVVREGKA